MAVTHIGAARDHHRLHFGAIRAGALVAGSKQRLNFSSC